MVLTTPAAGGRRGSDDPPLAAVAFDDDTFWAPLIDLAELHVVNLVASPTMLDHVCHLATPFPTESVRCSAALLLLQLRTILAALFVVKTHLWALAEFLGVFNRNLNLLLESRYHKAPPVYARAVWSDEASRTVSSQPWKITAHLL